MKRFYFLISLMLCASVLSCQKDSVETDTADDEEAKKEANNHVISETEWKKLVRRYRM